MSRHSGLLAPILLSASVMLSGPPALAQAGAPSTNAAPAPDYDSGASANKLSDSHLNTPEIDGRPGVKFFALGGLAFRKHDYAHAIDMFKVAASWAYKPAEYDLGVMYFNGHGVPVNRPLGAAWMVLAAERGEPHYTKVRDTMVSMLTQAEFAETDRLWGAMRETFGDKVALHRAKAQWAWVKSQETGTRVGGGAGALSVGVLNTGHAPTTIIKTNAFSLMHGGAMDGSVAYRQFRQSDNPYSPIFDEYNQGSVKVEPLTPIKAGSHAAPPSANKHGSAPPSSSD